MMGRRREPMINAPTVVVALIGLMVAIHALILQVPGRDQVWLVLSLAFIPARYGSAADLLPLEVLPGHPWAAWVSPFTHMLLHGDWIHLAMNSAWLLVFGTIIARRMNVVRFCGLAVLCGLAGAVAFGFVNAGEIAPMVGASGAVSGLMGGVFRFMFQPGRAGPLQFAPLVPLSRVLGNPSMVTAVLIWVGINVLFASDFAGLITEGRVAWEAHLGGFFAGFLLIGAFDQMRPQIYQIDLGQADDAGHGDDGDDIWPPDNRGAGDRH
ncbi:MAG: rhomboid family intramembrane serine protease [Hyphomicrobiaceae bacterium]